MVLVHGLLLAVFDLAARPLLSLCLIGLDFGAYFWAARRLETSHAVGAILCVSILLRLLLLPLPPSLSDDTLRYIWDGRVLTSGSNPYALAPDSPELAPLRDDLWQSMPHREVPTVYPPLALAFFSAASHMPLPLIGIKILLCFVEIIGCLLLLRLAELRGQAAGLAIWYCWNPLACLEVAGMGHVDGLVVVTQIAAVLYLTKARPWMAAGAAAGSVLAKLWPLVALPLWAHSSRRPLGFLLLAGGIILCFLAPVFLSTAGAPPGVVTYGVSWEFNGPLYEPLWRAFDHFDIVPDIKSGLDWAKSRTGHEAHWNRLYPYVYSQFLAKLTLAAAFALFLLSFGWRHEDPVLGSGRLFGALILCTATVYPWYLLLVLPWAALARHRAWLALSALIQLAYVPHLLSTEHWPYGHLAIWIPFFVLLLRSRWTRPTA